MLAFIHTHFTLVPLLILMLGGIALLAFCFQPGGEKESELARLKARIDTLEKGK